MPPRFLIIAAALLLSGLTARADDIETVTVTGDPVHLIEVRPDDTALGIAKPLTETPRAVTEVSDTTLDRYGVSGVDTLTAITPSAYTASYYGVEGAVNLRGTLAENYFRGFKRVENRGTYDTPLGDAAEIEILRGPPSPVYGAGKVGGLVNFIPKSDSGGDAAESGEVSATYGSYSKRNLAGQVGMPLDLAVCPGRRACLWRDGRQFQLLSRHASQPPDAGTLRPILQRAHWALSADYMYYHSNGEVQTPGWNRLTQALIDNGTYITGRNTSLKAVPTAMAG